MRSIVGVHGVNAYVRKQTSAETEAHLSRVWSTALSKSMSGERFDLSVSYYAHHLRGQEAQGADADPDTLDDEAIAMLAAWDELVNGPVGVDQGAITRVPRHIIGRMTGQPWGARATQLFILLFLRDVQRYLGCRNMERRTLARDSVAEAIRRKEATVVIAHSLGSVVAYEALWAHRDLEIDLLVTLGSPLGLRGVVFDRLVPAPVGVPAVRPPNVRKWVNLADPGDLCALPRWLGQSFSLDRDLESPIGTFAFHKVSRYLECAEVGAVLRD